MSINADFDLHEEIDSLRIGLAQKGLAFGALFIGIQGTGSYGFVFAEGMPQDIRMGMISDMEQTLKFARLTFQQ